MASASLIACNNGNKPTFERVYRNGVSTYHIDVTFVTEAHSSSITDWRVMDVYSMSYHKFIFFNMQLTSVVLPRVIVGRGRSKIPRNLRTIWSQRQFLERTHPSEKL